MMQLLWFLPTLFWMWMIYECVRNDPERNTWLWILIFLNIPGAVIYFIARKLPYLNLPVPNTFKSWLHRQKIWEAEAAAMNIGKAYQFVVLGNLYSDMGYTDKAETAYQTALEKEPNHSQALWGMSLIEKKKNNLETAKVYLEKLLRLDGEYQYGDAALLYAKTLVSLEEIDRAKKELEQIIKHWNKPEARLIIAEIYASEGRIPEACQHLETLLRNLKASPKFYYRQHQHIERKAQKFLKNLQN